MLLLLLLAVLPAPIVEGRVGEPAGAGAAGAQVTLMQGEKAQVRLTGPDGSFRFRAFPGPASISVVLPQGWMLDGPKATTVEAAPGKVVEAAFRAKARRVLRGRLIFGSEPVTDVEVEAGGVRTRADEHGRFVAEGVPGGRIAIRLDLASGSAEVPAGPGEVTRDVLLSVPKLSDLHLHALPQAPEARPLSAWVEQRPISGPESDEIERLAALVNLNPAFRLVMVAPPAEAARGLRAAIVFARYLAGPFLVPRERIAFAVGEVAPGGHLALVLMRPEGE